MLLHILVAVDLKNGIGLNNQLPWNVLNYQEDVMHFRNITYGKAIMMGMNTLKSFGKPLPNRINYVISSTKEFIPNCNIYENIDFAIKAAELEGHSDLFIIGGSQLFNYFKDSDRIDFYHVTHIKKIFKCDTFFPIELNHMTPISNTQIRDFQFVTYIKTINI